MILKALAILGLVTGLGQLCHAQPSTPTIGKTQALREVKVKSVGGWREAVSEQGNFRILFPGTPRVSDEVVTMIGFKFTERLGANWSAHFSDLSDAITDDVQVRSKYRDSIEAITYDGSRLLRQADIYLNGRLGSEFVVKGRGRISYMRVFLVGSRVWVLSADFRTASRGSTPPKDVRRFFDSFTFWE